MKIPISEFPLQNIDFSQNYETINKKDCSVANTKCIIVNRVMSSLLLLTRISGIGTLFAE